MTTYVQGTDTEQLAALYTVLAVLSVDPSGPPTIQVYEPNDQVTGVGILTLISIIPATVIVTYPGEFIEQSTGGFDWFESFHVIEREYIIGNVASSQSIAIQVFSAYRNTVSSWTAFTSTAGVGVDLGGAPSLPAETDPMTGYTMTLEIDVIGDAIVDANLIFTFTDGTATVPITLDRIVFFGIEPELPYNETLGSLTDIIQSKDGSEKRQALRANPRQSWEYNYIIQNDTERATLENILFDFQYLNFGIPVWFEDTSLTVAGAVDDTTLNVEETTYRDFRVGGFVVIFTDQTTFDVLKIASITTTTIVTDSALLNAYVIGTKVFPLASCTAQPVLSGSRPPVGVSRLAIKFENTDNATSLESTTPFSTFNSKVLLDNGNSVSGNVSETFQREFITIDSGGGLRLIDSAWDIQKRGHTFTLRANGRQAVWEMRGLLHALKGRFISFYVPRAIDDFVVLSDLLISSASVSITNIGYTKHVRSRQPKNVLRVIKTDGTVLLRTIDSSVINSTTVETLTVDSNWLATVALADIDRVEIVEKVRLDTDDIKISYDRSGQRAHMIAPVKAVQE